MTFSTFLTSVIFGAIGGFIGALAYAIFRYLIRKIGKP